MSCRQFDKSVVSVLKTDKPANSSDATRHRSPCTRIWRPTTQHMRVHATTHSHTHSPIVLAVVQITAGTKVFFAAEGKSHLAAGVIRAVKGNHVDVSVSCW
jgi:3D (Asp-Asp-Asp) domain-containing protein